MKLPQKRKTQTPQQLNKPVHVDYISHSWLNPGFYSECTQPVLPLAAYVKHTSAAPF